jgi:hypothetical protein
MGREHPTPQQTQHCCWSIVGKGQLQGAGGQKGGEGLQSPLLSSGHLLSCRMSLLGFSSEVVPGDS